MTPGAATWPRAQAWLRNGDWPDSLPPVRWQAGHVGQKFVAAAALQNPVAHPVQVSQIHQTLQRPAQALRRRTSALLGDKRDAHHRHQTPCSIPCLKASARTLISHLSQAASATVVMIAPFVRSSSSKAGQPAAPPVLRSRSACSWACSAHRNTSLPGPGKRANSSRSHGSKSCVAAAACSRTVAETGLSKGRSCTGRAPAVKPPSVASKWYACG